MTGCGSSSTQGDDAPGSNAGGGSGGIGGTPVSGGAAGTMVSTGGTTSSGGSGGAGGTSVSGPCPHVDLGSTVPVTHDGDTSGLANIATSQRLEWRDAPDDTLLFTAPHTGNYQVTNTDPSTNGGCDASIQESDGTYYDETWCPASGSVKTLDGWFSGKTSIPLVAGQKLLIWYSCAYWASVQSGAYSVTIVEL